MIHAPFFYFTIVFLKMLHRKQLFSDGGSGRPRRMLGLLFTIPKQGSFLVTFYKESSTADDRYKPLLIRILAVKK